MVNYDSVTIGLEVEFLIEEKVYYGIVRYKGGINGKEGVWIGIEAKQPIGFCDGRIAGRTYFKCPENYGLFLTADELRLASNHRKKKKNPLYKSIKSECDDLLFKKIEPQNHLICITEDYLNKAKNGFEVDNCDFLSSPPKYFKKSTLIFKSKQPVNENSIHENTFKPSSSIQKTFMPRDEMKLYSKLEWSYKNISLPKNIDLSNAFDSFNKNRSNYMDPSSY